MNERKKRMNQQKSKNLEKTVIRKSSGCIAYGQELVLYSYNSVFITAFPA